MHRLLIISMLPIIAVLGVFFSRNVTTYAQEETAELCIRAFEDTNSNGQFDAAEPNAIGIQVFISDRNNVIIGSLTTTLDEDCFRNFLTGTYTVTLSLPDQMRLTTGNNFEVTLTETPSTIDVGVVTGGTASSNEICVTIFNDISQNGQRESNEQLLGGINIIIQIDSVIIETQQSQFTGPTCFIGLSSGTYRVVIPETRRHLMTTRNDAAPSFTNTGSRFNVEFGGLLVDPFTSDAALPDFRGEPEDVDLDRETRILLAIMGSGIVMLTFIGLGALVLGLVHR